MLFTVTGFLGIDYPALLAAEELPALAETVMLDRDFAAFVASGKGAADPEVDLALAAVTPEHISDIMFTSGTTGVPKAVLMTHGRILPQVGVWIGNTGLARGERYLIANPFFHSFGMKVGWVACLLAGAVMVPMPQFDVAEAIRLIEQERIAFLPGPPTIFQMLLAERDKRAFDCSSLRGGTTGAGVHRSPARCPCCSRRDHRLVARQHGQLQSAAARHRGGRPAAQCRRQGAENRSQARSLKPQVSTVGGTS